MKTRRIALCTLLAFVIVNFALTSASVAAELTMQSSEGITLHGCGGDRNSWLENVTGHPMRVRRVYQGYGELTLAFDRLEPGAKLPVRYVNSRGFYIYTLDGLMVGFILGDCPSR
jgi:hypothetical protein